MINFTRRRFLKKTLVIAPPLSVGLIHTNLLAEPKQAYAVVDRQNASSVIEYRLIFTARVSGHTVSFPGHAFMLYGEYDNNERVCRFEKHNVLGFYPSKDASVTKVIFAIPVDGEVRTDLKSDLDASLITHRLDIKTAQNGFDACTTAAKKFAQANPYQIGNTDCVKLVETMLIALEAATKGSKDPLHIPSKSSFQTPQSYLTELFRANGLPL